MDVVAPAARASAYLLEEKEALAREITRRLYRVLPGLLDKYGDYGREKCLQDMRYNLEHLAPAVDLEQPEMFAGYVRWLDGLLRARNVATDELLRALELTGEVLAERLTADEQASVQSCVRAGTAALGGGR
ncbi:MAG TPA: hypothetical protein VF263_11940 [Longimicrobiaceae bacterium]